MSIDWNQAGLLLHVVNEAAKHGTTYAPLIDCARVELDVMNKDALDEMNARAEEAAKAKAETDAKERERLAKEAKDNAPKVVPATELENGHDTRRRL